MKLVYEIELDEEDAKKFCLDRSREIVEKMIDLNLIKVYNKEVIIELGGKDDNNRTNQSNS